MASDGGIFSYGDAGFYGSTGSIALNKPVVGMASTPDGRGYWLVASDGGIFSYGDAPFYGSTGSIALNKPVVGMASTPDGRGYWLVASDGGIFAYGDAGFYGSTGSIALNKPVIGMMAGPGGAGYFLVASDGGMFSFGDTQFFGSLGALPIKRPVVAAAATPNANGYWMTDAAGLVSNFGSARYFGSAPNPLNRPIVGMAEAPGNGSFVGAPFPSGSFGYDISRFQCNSFPTGDHQIGDRPGGRGLVHGRPTPVWPRRRQWAGGGLNLYSFLTYATSGTAEPGCQNDATGACNAGYEAGIHAFGDAQAAGVNTAVAWWLDVENDPARPGRAISASNAALVQGAINALHETEGVANVGIYASPGVWNSIVGNYQPDVPYWMADYLATRAAPARARTKSTGSTSGAQLPAGPLLLVQYNSQQYDEDYAC